VCGPTALRNAVYFCRSAVMDRIHLKNNKLKDNKTRYDEL